MTIIFDGTIQSGKLTLDKRDDFQVHLLSLEGKRVQLTVEKLKMTRSSQQNRYLWGVVYKLISDHTGHSAEELHSAFKYQWSPKVIVGNIIVPKSTRTHDTIEMTEYIEKIRRWAAEELSINIPDPEQVQV